MKQRWLWQKYYWWSHLLWLFKVMIKNFLLLDEKEFIESYWWIRIHLTYKSKRIK